MDSIITSDSFELQLKFENYLRLLTKKHNELSKKLSSTASLDKKEGKFKASEIGERRASTEGKQYKKVKLAGEKTHKYSFSARAKCKRTQPAKSQFGGFPEKSSDIPKVQKNDSNRFWSFVDCYCSAINSDDIKLLDKWIQSHDKDTEYQTIPELGVHYSSKWMEDDIEEDKKEGAKSMENPKGIDFLSMRNSSEVELMQKAQDKIRPTDSAQPPLVEKLVSSLVQENIITSPNDAMTEISPENGLLQKRCEKSRYLDGDLESHLRSQLAEIGVLEAENETDANDELLQELKRLQGMLIPICQFNLQKKNALLLRAKAEIAKQEAQKRIQEIDAKIMESYRMMAASRFKGKKLSKKELSQIKNTLEERNAMNRNIKSENLEL